MKNNLVKQFGIIFLILILFSVNASAASFTSNFLSSSKTTETTGSTLCQQGQDFVIQITPFGCTPSVIRSDLLEENNVPVYCQLGATQINPLINVKSIDTVSFSGQYSKEISGISFHPAKAALGIKGNLNSPVLNNIGYVVINLKKQPNSSAIPEYIMGNLTAKVKYNIQNAFGIGKVVFYLSSTTDPEWEVQKYKSGFWNGKGYIRVENLESDNADISVYSENGKISEFNLKKGATSSMIYLPGFECKAGLWVKLEDLDASTSRAVLKVDSDIFEVAQGEKFLDNKCTVTSLKNYGINKQVTINCQEDSGLKLSTLRIAPKVNLSIGGIEKEYSVGDYLFDRIPNSSTKRIEPVHLVYVGTLKNSKDSKDLVIYVARVPGATKEQPLTEAQILSFSPLIEDMNAQDRTGFVGEVSEQKAKAAGTTIARLFQFILEGESMYGIKKGEENNNYGFAVILKGLAEGKDIELTGEAKGYYENAKEDYETIIESYSSEESEKTTFGEQALYNEIKLVSFSNQKAVVKELCDNYKQKYPSNQLPSECNDFQIASTEANSREVTINKVIKKISFEWVEEPDFNDYGAIVNINNIPYSLGKNQIISLPGENNKVQLISINGDSIKLKISLSSTTAMESIKKEFGSDTITLEKDMLKLVEGYSFLVSKINFKGLAKVSVIPNLDASGTNANFSFKVGIEKRAIQLAPEKINKTIQDLNSTIIKWGKISASLGTAVESLKTACLATGVALVAKNFFTNAGTGGGARTWIMRGEDGGWFKKCDTLVLQGKFETVAECFANSSISNQIDAEVSLVSQLTETRNAKIKQWEADYPVETKLFDTPSVDTEKIVEKYSSDILVRLSEYIPTAFTQDSELSTMFSFEGFEKGYYSESQLEEIDLYLSIIEDTTSTSELKEKARVGLTSTIQEIVDNKAAYNASLNQDKKIISNRYDNPTLRYYETEPYKGMPAVVPLDKASGWYAGVKQTVAIGSNIRSYDSSGRLVSFWLCNVGENRIEEFQIGNKDDCQMINLGMIGSYDSATKSLITKASNAITEAARVHSKAVADKKITINGVSMDVGESAIDLPQFQCEDFMSPKDCLLMFNLCDPVICPASRCDLGGAYQVPDVIQSGIVGSLFLCLPNANKGIVVPICLTGVKAGLDSFLSVLKGTRDCLQTSLTTGETIGICDEIFSVYMCDFIWKQVMPISDILIPKVLDMITGQNVRGGGEYLGIASAWNMASKSVNYFTSYYGANSKQAFLTRTTEGITDGVCKMFISGVVPSGADFLSSITKADSPVQFTARFDEIPLSTATVPPTSHYKVFFYIYSGNDSGVNYQVYLKPNSNSYYRDTLSSVVIDSGYIAMGGYASKTVDKIETSGYNQLCVNVNGVEQCGFQQVSTSFAVNYVKDKYLEEQATQTDITTENECISGTMSAYSLLNPNVQSAAENLIDPELYNQGIIRRCSTTNPGQGTDNYIGTANARWKNVGYCGNTKTRCWIDTKSVEETIKTITVEKGALKEVTDSYLEKLKAEGGYLNEKEFDDNLTKIKDVKTTDNQKITLINKIIDKVFSNKEKAQLHFLRGNAYYSLFKETKVNAETKKNETSAPTTTTSTTTADTPSIIIPVNSGETILAIAKGFADEKWQETREEDKSGKRCNLDETCFDDVAARFVIRVLAEVGVETTELISLLKGDVLTVSDYEDIKKLTELFDSNQDQYTKITESNQLESELQKGDIIVFAKKTFFGLNTVRFAHVGIFSKYGNDREEIINGDEKIIKTIFVYEEPGYLNNEDFSWVKLTNFPVSIVEDSYFVYRAYRYIGE